MSGQQEGSQNSGPGGNRPPRLPSWLGPRDDDVPDSDGQRALERQRGAGIARGLLSRYMRDPGAFPPPPAAGQTPFPPMPPTLSQDLERADEGRVAPPRLSSTAPSGRPDFEERRRAYNEGRGHPGPPPATMPASSTGPRRQQRPFAEPTEGALANDPPHGGHRMRFNDIFNPDEATRTAMSQLPRSSVTPPRGPRYQDRFINLDASSREFQSGGSTRTRPSRQSATEGPSAIGHAQTAPNPSSEDQRIRIGGRLTRVPGGEPSLLSLTPGTATTQRDYGRLTRDRPPANVTIREPDNGSNIQIGMLEICTFFPSWFQIPHVMARAIRNGWTYGAIAKAQLHATDAMSQQNLKKALDRLKKQGSDGCKMWGTGWDSARHGNFSIQKFRNMHGNDDDLTRRQWKQRSEYGQNPRAGNEGHIKLSHIRKAVRDDRWPTSNTPSGDHRLALTRCLEFDEANPQLKLDTSQIGWLVDQLQLDQVVRQLDHRHDVAAFNYVQQHIPDPHSDDEEDEDEVEVEDEEGQ